MLTDRQEFILRWVLLLTGAAALLAGIAIKFDWTTAMMLGGVVAIMLSLIFN